MKDFFYFQPMKKLLLLFLFTTIQQITAQTNPKKELGVWYMYNGSHQISNRISIKSMAHFRFFEVGDDLQQFIGRFGATYKINNTLSATGGYAFLNTDDTYQIKGGTTNEHRTYQDFNVKHALKKLKIAHRFRAEQRFFNDIFDHFLRYQIGLSHPINHKWSAYFYSETFFDFNEEAYNQNWSGIGAKYQLSKTVKLQLGYQKINVNEVGDFHRIQVGFAINTNHFKKK